MHKQIRMYILLYCKYQEITLIITVCCTVCDVHTCICTYVCTNVNQTHLNVVSCEMGVPTSLSCPHLSDVQNTPIAGHGNKGQSLTVGDKSIAMAARKKQNLLYCTCRPAQTSTSASHMGYFAAVLALQE